MACQDIHRKIADGAPAEARTRIDELLKVVEPATVSVFEELRADPGKTGVDNLISAADHPRGWPKQRCVLRLALEGASAAAHDRVLNADYEAPMRTFPVR